MTTPTDPARVIAEARRQFEKEQFDLAVAAEVRLIRTTHQRSFWQRLLDKLPFTIEVRKKP